MMAPVLRPLRSALARLIVTIGVVAAGAALGLLEARAAEQLPWGRMASPPRVVTPESGLDILTARYPRPGPRSGPAADPYASPPPSPPSYPTPGPYAAAGPQAYNAPPPAPYGYQQRSDRTFTIEEIRDAGHRFFGTISTGLAKVIEYAFQRAGRPTGYILGEEAGGAFIAGVRYGEGWLHTKSGERYKVYWQGPSIGYDFGAEGSKTMILVYNLYDPSDIYNRFAGVDGSAYLVGGVGITFQAHNDIRLAPIRAGVGLRFGANVGYLHYTRRPSWLPF